jgi:hypothetical protein
MDTKKVIEKTRPVTIRVGEGGMLVAPSAGHRVEKKKYREPSVKRLCVVADGTHGKTVRTITEGILTFTHLGPS